MAGEGPEQRAWYFHAIALRERHAPGALQAGALQAFAWAVRLDPTFINGRLAFCIELYRTGREMESVVCSEHLPLNEVRDEYVANTFKHPVLVGGMNKSLQVSDEDARILSAVLGQPGLAPSSGLRPSR